MKSIRFRKQRLNLHRLNLFQIHSSQLFLQVLSIIVTDGGTGYTTGVAPTVTITSPTGTGAAATATIDSATGTVSKITLDADSSTVKHGANYTTATVTISGGGGTGAGWGGRGDRRDVGPPHRAYPPRRERYDDRSMSPPQKRMREW